MDGGPEGNTVLHFSSRQLLGRGLFQFSSWCTQVGDCDFIRDYKQYCANRELITNIIRNVPLVIRPLR